MLSAIVSSLLLSTNNVMAFDSITSGSACQPANMKQGLNRNYAVSQFGAANNGTDLSFYVICPLTFDSALEYTTVVFAIDYKNSIGAVGDETLCIFREADAANDNLGAISISTTNNGVVNAGVGFIDSATNEFGANLTLVCPLQPGETLTVYGVFE